MPEPQPDRKIDEFDVALLDALHVSPRASFEQLADALEVSAVTVARRWQRLSSSGRAWVSSVLGPRLAVVAALYEVRAVPGRNAQLARALAQVPQVASVYLTAGSFDLHALIVAPDMGTLSALLLDQLPRAQGIAEARVSVSTAWYSDVHWRLGAISRSQAHTVASDDAGAHHAREERAKQFGDADRLLYLALQRDGRARFRDLAAELGTTEQVIKRRITALTRDGLLALRTDFVRGEGGWPAQLAVWLTVGEDRIDQVGDQLAKWQETRFCLATLGPANLFLQVQLHRLDDAGELLARIATRFPDVAVADRRLVLRPVKSWGRLLDGTGLATGVVPVDPWAPVA
jgi:DNA-binding Lrp family transcriptional regulator